MCSGLINKKKWNMEIKSVSFKGNIVNNVQLKKDINSLMPKSVKFIDKMSGLKGDIPNILIFVAGSGAVAPLVILLNKYSNMEKKTREYMSIRQVISALVTLAVQVGIFLPFDKIISKMSNLGEFSNTKYNKNGFQDLKYLQNKVKKENPHLSKDEIKNQAKLIQAKQLENMLNQLHEKNTFSYEHQGKNISLGKNEMDLLIKETFTDLSKNAPDKKNKFNALLEKLTGKSVKEISKDVKGIDNDIDFAANLIQKHIHKTGRRVDGLRIVIGIALSLLVMSPSIKLFNYIYPKIINKLFPNLADVKNTTTTQNNDKILDKKIINEVQNGKH